MRIILRVGDWKLVKTMDGPLKEADPSTFSNLADAQLYNLAEDIGEKKNLATTHPEKVKELAVDWQRWNRELAKPAWPPG